MAPNGAPEGAPFHNRDLQRVFCNELRHAHTFPSHAVRRGFSRPAGTGVMVSFEPGVETPGYFLPSLWGSVTSRFQRLPSGHKVPRLRRAILRIVPLRSG